LKKLAFAAVLAALVSACGGGGSSDPASTPPGVTFNIDAAVTTALTKGLSLSNLQGQIGASTYTLGETFTPQPDGSPLVNGTPYHSATQVYSIKSGGTTLSTGGARLYFSTGPVQLRYTDASTYFEAYTQVAALPTGATVGQHGGWTTATMYASKFSTTPIGSDTVSWSLEPDTGSTAWACLSYVITGSVVGGEKDCYRIDPAGNISGARFTATVNGQVVTFQ
jgi:hypothetical protein